MKIKEIHFSIGNQLNWFHNEFKFLIKTKGVEVDEWSNIIAYIIYFC